MLYNPATAAAPLAENYRGKRNPIDPNGLITLLRAADGEERTRRFPGKHASDGYLASQTKQLFFLSIS